MKYEMSVLPRALRAALIALQGVAVLNVLYLIVHIVMDSIDGTQSAPPRAVAMGLVFVSGVPWSIVALVRRSLAGTLEVHEAYIILSLRRSRLEIPIASVKAIRPLVIPLPWPGLALGMQSGHLFRYRLFVNEPGTLLSALAPSFEPARAASASPAMAYANAKRTHTWRHRALVVAKWLVFPLLLGGILFRLDQYIMFGGAFGQYHLQGWRPYLASFATYWAGSASYLVLYASMLRLAVEPLVFALTWLAASRAKTHAVTLRRIGEAICQSAYFVLLPAFVAYRLLLM